MCVCSHYERHGKDRIKDGFNLGAAGLELGRLVHVRALVRLFLGGKFGKSVTTKTADVENLCKNPPHI